MQIKAPCKVDSHQVCFLLKFQSFPLDKEYPFQLFSNDSKEIPFRDQLNVFLCVFQVSYQMGKQIESSLDQMEEFYLQGRLYQIYNLIRRVSKSIFMNTQSAQTRSKPHLNSSKTAFKPFIIQFSHSSYNQQILKRKSTQKNKKMYIKHHNNSQFKENSPILSVKENIEMEIKNLKAQFTINSIEELILGPVSKEDRMKYVYNVYRGVVYSQLKLRPPSEDLVHSRSVFLSEPTGSTKKFLLLDLDETLIHTERSTQNNSKASYRFAYRPHLFPFLERMGQLFEVYVFTAAQKGYAEAIVRKLNRKRVLVQDLLHRQHCLETRKGRFLKDLRIVGNRGLQQIVMIDNLVESFGLQLSNGVPILEFTGAADDAELLKIIPLMEEISRAEDVRSVLREKLRLEEVCGLDRKDVDAYFVTTA